MSVPTTYYGWHEGGLWYLSIFPRAAGKARNAYPSKKAAEDAAHARTDNLVTMIIWET